MDHDIDQIIQISNTTQVLRPYQFDGFDDYQNDFLYDSIRIVRYDLHEPISRPRGLQVCLQALQLLPTQFPMCYFRIFK